VTIGFYSPLPPARTGVADYSAAMLQALKERITVNVNADGDVNLYHLGNNQLHASIYTRALECPGIVVLHDAVLQHFALGFFSREEYVKEFAYNYGEWACDLAANLWNNRARSGGDSEYFRYPMLRRVAEQSKVVIVHNPAAAAMVREHCATARIAEIPHLLAPVVFPHGSKAEILRAQLGGSPLFGIFGHLRESKRVLPVLRLFSRLTNYRLLLAGEMVSSDLRRAVEPYLSLPNVRHIGYMSPGTYWTAALAIDACINLRYPAAGETSGVSVGMMGAGTPVIMTDSLENSRYPEDTCIKISAGLREEAELEAMVRWVADHRSHVRNMGRRAADYTRETHAISKVTDKLIECVGSL
jgi:glycosyltransferase involved in cell wall biosynthesis